MLRAKVDMDNRVSMGDGVSGVSSVIGEMGEKGEREEKEGNGWNGGKGGENFDKYNDSARGNVIDCTGKAAAGSTVCVRALGKKCKKKEK